MMGMYDYVNFKSKCPKCSEVVTGFQSQDGPCEMKTLEYKDVDNFYTNCDKCNATIEYLKIDNRPYIRIESYELESLDKENLTAVKPTFEEIEIQLDAYLTAEIMLENKPDDKFSKAMATQLRADLLKAIKAYGE